MAVSITVVERAANWEGIAQGQIVVVIESPPEVRFTTSTRQKLCVVEILLFYWHIHDERLNSLTTSGDSN